MKSESLIALRLGTSSSSATGLELKSVLDRALVLVGHVLLAVDDEHERIELTAGLDTFRARFASASRPDEISALTASCFDMCEHAIQALQAQQAERRSELRRLVALVRDTVTVLAGDGDSLSSQITQAASRFNALIQIDDVSVLKQRLMAEVGDLQRVAAERQHQWRETIGTFEKRVVALEQQLIELGREASSDALTGIANRRSFERAVREAIEAPERQFLLALIDLDGFKALNDAGGHPTGDAVLKEVAGHLKSSIRRNDIVARIGGDEFALLAMGATLREAEPRLRSLIGAIAQVPTGLEPMVTVSASCGMAEFCAGDTLESLMRRADQALYEAKATGRNKVIAKAA